MYISSDAHALRRYVDESWAWSWKMINGLRIWCEDKDSGEIIHLGGEFTWGDCEVVGRRVQSLREAGVMPNHSPEWIKVDAQVAFVSDGMEWFVRHILSLFPDALAILDAHHVISWFAAFGALVFGAGSEGCRQLHSGAWTAVLGERPRPERASSKRRRGHKKSSRRAPRLVHRREAELSARTRRRGADSTTRALLDMLADLALDQAAHEEAREALARRIQSNAVRMQYPLFMRRGYQLGSGAMESLHKQGSQQRLKRPGARWQEETSAAVLNLRMLELAGRWDEFWGQPSLPNFLEAGFRNVRRSPEYRAA
jgi:hypothetical protein